MLLIPITLGVLLVLLLGLIGWEYWLAGKPTSKAGSRQWLDYVLLALLALTAVAAGLLAIAALYNRTG